VGRCLVFNILHNRYRLICIVVFKGHTLYSSTSLIMQNMTAKNGKGTAVSKVQTYERVAQNVGVPRRVSNDREYRHTLAIIRVLMEKGESMSNAEADLLETWAQLVSKYEEDISPPGDVDPVEMVKFLMEQKGLKNVDLIPAIFSSPSNASEVLNGKKSISKSVGVKLARYFGLPVEYFLTVEIKA